MSVFGGTPRVGVAVGPGAVTGLVEGSATRPERVEVSPGEDAPGTWLAAAMQALARRLETTHGRPMEGAHVAVALLPPLADTRLLTLPPLRRGELEAVVRRDAPRHFVGIEVPRVIGVARSGGRGSGPAPVLVAAAPAAFLEALRRGVDATGWRLDSVVPAPAAWRAAGIRGRGDEGVVVAVVDGTAHVLGLEAGRMTSLRRVPLDLVDALSEAVGRGRGAAVVFGDTAPASTVVETLERSGWTLPAREGGRPTAAEAAARHARGAAPELVPPLLAAERTDRARRRAFRMVGLAAVLVVGAGAVHLWGAGRELDAVRARRAEIRERVAPLVAARDSLEVLSGRVAAIDEITDRSPRWTRALYELALLLPRDAHLTSLVASEESLEIEAEARRAGMAIQALRGAESFRDVELLGLVERELEDGETVVERFRVGATLAPPESAPETTGDGGPS